MATLLFTENFFNVWDCNMFCFSFLNRIFFVIRYYYIHRLQIKKEGKIERKKERKKESTKFKKCTSIWPLLIVIQLTYTRIGFVYLI